MPDAKRSSGSIALNAQEVKISPNGRAVVGLEISGTWVANLDVKAVIDGTEQDAIVVTAAGVAVVLPLTVNQIAFVNAVGVEQVIVRANGFTSGPAVVVLNATDGPLPSAAGTAGALTQSDFDTKIGSLTETAPATDIASSGTNGRLQRIAQNITTSIASLTSLIAKFPAALVSGRLDVNLGAAPAVVTAGGITPAAPTCTFTRGANATPYSIGDEVGTSGTAPTTVAVARVNGGSGMILGAQVVYSSYAATVPQLVVLLFSATVTLAGDNNNLLLSDADAALCIGVIPLTASQSLNYVANAPAAAGNTIFVGAPTAPIEFTTGGAQTTIYAAIITLNAWTPIANSETLVCTLRCECN